MTGASFPWATLAINVSGSLLVGVLFATGIERAALGAEARGLLLIGFLGAYTTFSIMALESWRMLDDGSVTLALANLRATVLRGIAGFGAHARLHTTRLLALSEDLPILIEVVDTDEKVRAILPSLDELIGGGLITLEHVEVVAYRGEDHAS